MRGEPSENLLRTRPGAPRPESAEPRLFSDAGSHPGNPEIPAGSPALGELRAERRAPVRSSAISPTGRGRTAAGRLPAGTLLYLVLIGLIATATAVAFFGVGFKLLAPSANQPAAATPRSAAAAPPPLKTGVPPPRTAAIAIPNPTQRLRSRADASVPLPPTSAGGAVPSSPATAPAAPTAAAPTAGAGPAAAAPSLHPAEATANPPPPPPKPAARAVSQAEHAPPGAEPSLPEHAARAPSAPSPGGTPAAGTTATAAAAPPVPKTSAPDHQVMTSPARIHSAAPRRTVLRRAPVGSRREARSTAARHPSTQSLPPPGRAARAVPQPAAPQAGQAAAFDQLLAHLTRTPASAGAGAAPPPARRSFTAAPSRSARSPHIAAAPASAGDTLTPPPPGAADPFASHDRDQ